MLRVTHALCGTAMIVTGAILDTVGEGGWRLIALGVAGVIVLLSSYRPEPNNQPDPL